MKFFHSLRFTHSSKIISFCKKLISASFESFFIISKFTRTSSFVSRIFPIKVIKTSAPCAHKIRARAAPSPPLFPLPHKIKNDFPATEPPSFSVITRAAAWAAFSIKRIDGMPYFSVVRRSTSRISAAVKTFCIFQ